MANQPEEQLLDAFVAAFGAFDDMLLFGESAAEMPFAVDGVNELGLRQWQPSRAATSRAALDELYRQLPHGLPTLFEDLLLRWRWPAVEIGTIQLLANPVGLDLSGFVGEVLKDRGLAEVLLPAGYVQFGRAGGGSYDPVCFDTARGRTAGDARVVQLDHEEILIHQRLGAVRVLQPTFRHLVAEVVASAAQSPRRAV